eukprot:756622-Rhodomonas_salina.1
MSSGAAATRRAEAGRAAAALRCVGEEAPARGLNAALLVLVLSLLGSTENDDDHHQNEEEEGKWRRRARARDRRGAGCG